MGYKMVVLHKAVDTAKSCNIIMVDQVDRRTKMQKIWNSVFCAFWMFPNGVIKIGDKITDQQSFDELNAMMK